MFFFRRPRYFPKQLFLRFVLRQILGAVPLLLVAALLARFYLTDRLAGPQTLAEVTAAYDRAFLFLALVMIATVTGISLWTGYGLVMPLGRILVKARSIQRREYGSASREENAADGEGDGDDQGEWSDLDSTLHRIGRDMQKKDQTLSRERGEVETIISAIVEAVVAVDHQGRLLFYNSRFALLFGDQLRSQSRLSDLFRNNDVLETFRGTLRGGESAATPVRLRAQGQDQLRHFSLSVAPLKGEGGTIYGALGVFHDVSDLKHMDQVRIDFVANVSHELRTPLTAIKGYAQTLRGDFPEQHSSRKFLETIERNTDRLISLVQDLLSLSSLESGTELSREPVDLAALTRRVSAQLEPQRQEKRQQLVTEVRVPSLYGDEKRLEQVLYNLLENAIKYVPPLGRIEVHWEGDGASTSLRVSDNGPGIPAEHHGRIFERFYRVDSARAREQGGTGLGLSIVKHIVQRHGGRISVRANPGGGTEFLCTFPGEA